MSSEPLALQRAEANGYRPREDYPGRINLPWLLECIDCGEQSRRRPTPQLRPCEHKERARQHRAEKTADKQYRDVVLPVRTHTLRTKNLRALEDYPGKGERWWVQCKYCGRTWHMPEDTLRACPHKGAGDPGHPPIPEPAKPKTKATAAPPTVDEMTVLPGLVGRHAYLVEADGQWSLRVSRYMEVPGLDDWLLLLHVPLDEPSTAAAEEHLRAAGWTVGPKGWKDPGKPACWSAGRARLYTEVTSPLLTEYALARDVLGSQAKKPEKTAQNFLKRTRTKPAGTGRDSSGREWPLYLRAEAEASRRCARSRSPWSPTSSG